MNGFTLLEVLIALAVITIIMGAALSLLWQVLGSSNVARSRLIATYLVQEGIEKVRNIRDSNWLYQRSVNPALPWDSGLDAGVWQDGYVEVGPDYSDFWRKIVISKPEPHILEIVSEVSWQEKNREHSIRTEEHLWNSLGLD